MIKEGIDFVKQEIKEEIIKYVNKKLLALRQETKVKNKSNIELILLKIKAVMENKFKKTFKMHITASRRC